jgi:hypothetical protein
MLHRQTANAWLAGVPPMTAQIATVLGPALDEPGALQRLTPSMSAKGKHVKKARGVNPTASHQEAATRSSLVERRQWDMGWHCNRRKRAAA